MNFVEELNYDFVREFAESLGLKNYHIVKSFEGWHINFYNEENNILVGNFIIQSELGAEFCNNATKQWQIKMYKKFGKRYYRELKRFEYFRFKMKYTAKKSILKEDLKAIKNTAIEK